MTQEQSLDPLSKSRIQWLPEHLIDQIKAGEIIERPAYLLKELIENSIDAKSKKINIHLVNNGLELFHIADDGIGMSFEDLKVAFLRHTTSKIRNFEDLFTLESYGFRGEALAAISAMSRVHCTSFPREDYEAHGTKARGGKIVIHGGHLQSHTPLSENSGNSGTQFFVRDLFFNTPARLKFIRSKLSEKNAIKKIFYAFVLSHPEIKFTFKWDDKEKEIFPELAQSDPEQREQKEQWEQREQRIFKILSIDSQNPETYVRIKGNYQSYLVDGIIEISEGKSKISSQQFLFINDRYIQDKQLHHIIMSSLQNAGKIISANYCLFLKVPSQKLDVNVHPTKTIIKFEEPSIIYSLLTSSVRKATTWSSSAPSPIPSSSTYLKKASALVENSSSTEAISKKYMLIKENFENHGPYYALHYPKCLGYYYYQQILEKKDHFLESEVIPLLIGRPFITHAHTIDSLLHQLKIIGFEFDRSGPSTLILRTIPKYFDHDSPAYNDFIQELIDHFEGHTLLMVDHTHFLEHLKKFLFHILPEKISLPMNWNFAKTMLETLKLQPLIQQRILIPINDELLEK